MYFNNSLNDDQNSTDPSLPVVGHDNGKGLGADRDVDVDVVYLLQFRGNRKRRANRQHTMSCVTQSSSRSNKVGNVDAHKQLNRQRVRSIATTSSLHKVDNIRNILSNVSQSRANGGKTKDEIS